MPVRDNELQRMVRRREFVVPWRQPSLCCAINNIAYSSIRTSIIPTDDASRSRGAGKIVICGSPLKTFRMNSEWRGAIASLHVACGGDLAHRRPPRVVFLHGVAVTRRNRMPDF